MLKESQCLLVEKIILWVNGADVLGYLVDSWALLRWLGWLGQRLGWYAENAHDVVVAVVGDDNVVICLDALH